MKVVAYLTEPASYTLDLMLSVHIPNNIDCRFLFNTTHAQSKVANQFKDFIYLNELSIIKRYQLLKEDYNKNNVIIFNGYDSISFLILWLIHILAKRKKSIAIESDTPLKVPKNIFKRFIKNGI